MSEKAHLLTSVIAAAIKAHDFPAVVTVLEALAVEDPVQAQAVYSTIQAGLMP